MFVCLESFHQTDSVFDRISYICRQIHVIHLVSDRSIRPLSVDRIQVTLDAEVVNTYDRCFFLDNTIFFVFFGNFQPVVNLIVTVDYTTCSVEQLNPDSPAFFVGTNFRDKYIFRSELRSEATYGNFVIFSTRNGFPIEFSIATTNFTICRFFDSRISQTCSKCYTQIFVYIANSSQRNNIFYVTQVFYIRSSTKIDLSNYVTTHYVFNKIVLTTFENIVQRPVFHVTIHSQSQRLFTNIQFFCFSCTECEHVRVADQINLLFYFVFRFDSRRSVMRQVTTLNIDYRIFHLACIYYTKLEVFDLLLTFSVRTVPYFRYFNVTLDLSSQSIVDIDTVRSKESKIQPFLIIEFQCSFIIIQIIEANTVCDFVRTLLRSQLNCILGIIACPHALCRTCIDRINAHSNTITVNRIECNIHGDQNFTVLIRIDLNLTVY